MNASTTALLVLDLQPVTLGMLKDDELAKKVLDNNKKLIEAARSKNILIAFVRVAFNNEEFQNIPSTNKVSISL
jgi:nicotinamidase-related amidase